MSAPIEIPSGFSQIALVHDVPGAHGEVIVTWAISNVGSETTDLRLVMDAWQDEVIEPCMTTNVTFVEGRSLRGPRPGTPTLSLLADPGKPTVGAQGPGALPVNCATLVSTITALGGVQFRGRKYLPGVSEGAVDDAGNLSTAGQSQFQDAMDLFYGVVTAGSNELVILHSPPLVDPGPPPVYGTAPAPTNILELRVQRKMATQRTRLRG